MPYKLKISEDEVREELTRLGFADVSDDVVRTFRKDLLRLIKQDLKAFKAQQESGEEKSFSSSKSETTSSFSDSSPDTQKPSKEKLKIPKKYRTWVSSEESGYSDQDSSASHTKTSDDSSSYAGQRSSRHDRPREQQSESSTLTSSSTSGSTEKSVDLKRRPGIKQRPRSVSRKKPTPLPSEPSNKRDPVTLYHFYKAYWDKFKVPGEDARAALRWNVRTKMVLGDSYP